MSGYQPGRRGPNVSHYIAGLNLIPQENDFAQDDSLYNFEDDLALFTNTEFIHNDIIDFDLDFDFTQSIPGEEDYLKQHQPQQQQEQSHASDQLKAAPLSIGQLHNSTTIQPLATTSNPTKKQKLSPPSARITKQAIVSASTSSTTTSTTEPSHSSPETSTAGVFDTASSAQTSPVIPVPSTDNTSSNLLGSNQPSSSQSRDGEMNFDGNFHFTDIGFTPQGNITNHNIPYGASTSGYEYSIPPQSPFDPNNQLNTPVTTPPNGQAGVRPQGILPNAAALLEASSRAAVEEDKRRRNTAASARFRYKKKQREHALEKSAKDMTDKLDRMEERINQLEKENTWLRGLVVERTAKTSEEMAELYKTFKDEERSKDSHKKGVGTLKPEK